MGPFEAKGLWWLAGRDGPDARVPGILTVDNKGNAELALIGTFTDRFHGVTPQVGASGTVSYTIRDEDIAKSGVYPRILGQCGNVGYTLEDCFRRNWTSHVFGDAGFETIHVHRIFEGVHFEPGEALGFTEIVVGMHGLAYWVARSGFKESETYQTEEGSDAVRRFVKHSLETAPVETETFAGLDDSTVRLAQTYSIRGDMVVERGVAQDFYFGVKYPVLTGLDDLLSVASHLQDLVSVGLGRAAAFSSVSLRHPSVTREFNDSEPRLVPIEMTASWTVTLPADSKPFTRHGLIFDLEDLGGCGAISKWLKVAHRNRSALGRVMSTRYAEAMYAGDHLLNCAAALEAYDRDKHQDDIYYIKRVKRCASWAGTPFMSLIGDVEEWARRMKKNRADVAHHLAGVEGASTEHVFLSKSAFWLFIFCLFRDIGVPERVFDRILEHSETRWLKRHLDQVMATP